MTLPAHGASLASLLGSQADAFDQQLHAPAHTSTAAPLRTPSKPKKAGSRSPALAPAAAPVSLTIPFTHTLHPPQLLSSLLALTAPAATAAPAAGKHAASKASAAAAAAAAATAAASGAPTSVAVVASQLQGSLSGAQALLAQLLPTSVEDTPKPKHFHALLLQYLHQCGTGLQAQKESSAATSSGDKKRKRADESSASGPSDSAIAVALHTVSTTVVGRLAARCIQMLSDGTLAASSTSSGAFDSALLRSADSYWSILALLLRSDSLSARFTPSLFSLLTRHDALPLIESALVHMHDAAERDLVELTKYALDNLPAPAVSTQTLPLHSQQQADDTQGSKKKRKKAARNMIHAARAQHTVHVVEVPGGAFAVILSVDQAHRAEGCAHTSVWLVKEACDWMIHDRCVLTVARLLAVCAWFCTAPYPAVICC